MSGATILLDTNVLLRAALESDPDHAVVVRALRRLDRDGDEGCVTTQNVAELWNVLTRPVGRNGYGLAPDAADERLRRLEARFRLLPDTPAVYPIWRRLVVAYGVRGVQVHDARLAAAMLAHGVGRLLTFNGADFRRYAPEGVIAVAPAEVAA